MKANIYIVVHLVLVVFFALPTVHVEGQSTSCEVLGSCRIHTCDKPHGASHFEIITNGCDITSTRPCASELQRLGYVGVCSVSDDSVTYKCPISVAYTDPVCCRSYERGVSDPTFNFCISSTVSTESPTEPTDITSASASTWPNVSSTSPPEIPHETSVNDPIPASVVAVIIVFSVIVVLAVLAVLVLFMCIRRCRRESVSLPAQDHNGGDGDHTPSINHQNGNEHHMDAAGGVPADGQSNTSQDDHDSQPAYQGGSQAMVTTVRKHHSTENGLRRRKKLRTDETRHRPQQPVQEATEIEEELRWSSRTAGPFINGVGTGLVAQSVVQPFLDTYEPPVCDPISLLPEHNTDTSSLGCSTTAQATDEGHSPYVTLLPKSTSLVRKLDTKELVTVHMSILGCMDGTHENLAITDVVQDDMQSTNQGNQTGISVSEKDSLKKCSHSLDDRTGSCVSGNDPLNKKCKFAPCLFGAVVVTITCILTLASCVLPHPHHGSIYTHPSTVLHPSLAEKYRWLDGGTPWIEALEPLMYPQMFAPHNLRLYPLMYPRMFYLRPAVSCAIFMLVTHTMTLVMATFISLSNRFQTRPTYPAVHHRTSLAAVGPRVDTPRSVIGAASCRTVNTHTY